MTSPAFVRRGRLPWQVWWMTRPAADTVRIAFPPWSDIGVRLPRRDLPVPHSCPCFVCQRTRQRERARSWFASALKDALEDLGDVRFAPAPRLSDEDLERLRGLKWVP